MRARAGRRAHQADARLERIDLRVAARPDRSGGIEPHDAPKRSAFQPARVDSRRHSPSMLVAQVPGIILGRRVVHGVAVGEVARDAQPCQRGDELTRRLPAELPDPLRARSAVAPREVGEILVRLLHEQRGAYTSYAVSGRVEKGRVPDALFWDTADPYHYLRIEPQRDHDVVIFGGEDHKTGQASDTSACFDRLERTLASMLGAVEITHRWSGQVIGTADGLPFIGDTAPHQFAGTGYSGNGMTFGTLAGMMAADRIMGRANPWSALFDPSRKTIAGLWDYVKENKDYPYYLVRDRCAGTEGTSLRAVPRESGKVLDLNGRAVAVYRDERGAVTKKSAVCTHMGCLVDWNEAERTRDCPCHGSRFKPDGAVVAGPAESPLGDAEE
jgi:Rieske Fe-S protein